MCASSSVTIRHDSPSSMSSSTPTLVRPRLHITVPYWLNDPCAPAYNSRTGLYHLFYQCNPFSIEWGNMSWGHVVSKDLLHWTFAITQPALKPDQEYDIAGVFTGCMVPSNGSQSLHVFYSSVCKIPFHWSSPYPRNSVGLAMAASEDGGRTWVKSDCNPILKGEPEHITVSGYRDPYIGAWRGLDTLRNTKGLLYGLVSGGIDGKGPTSFLYAVHPDRLDKWQYIGPLVDFPLRWNPSTKWSGNFGINWECVNFFTLTSNTPRTTNTEISHDFLLIGAEGDTERPDIHNHKLPKDLPPRTVRTQVWMQGTLIKSESGEIRFRHNYSGLFDHGPYYAANSFVVPRSLRRIVYGWIPEEDCSLEVAGRKGWNGIQALPRELFVQTIGNVSQALCTPLNDITNIEIDKKQLATTKSTTVRTMGIRPIAELSRLRNNCLRSYDINQFGLGCASSLSSVGDARHLANTTDATWELDTTITVLPSCRFVGFHFNHNVDLSVQTTLKFDVVNEQMELDRSKSVSDPDLVAHVNTCSDSGPFTLFTTMSKTTTATATATAELEKLHIRIFSDGNCVEVFVNDRFTIATVVYTGHHRGSSSSGDNTYGGITAFAESNHRPRPNDNNYNDDGRQRREKESEDYSGAAAVFETIKIWDGLNGGRSLISGWEHVNKSCSAASAGVSGRGGSGDISDTRDDATTSRDRDEHSSSHL